MSCTQYGRPGHTFLTEEPNQKNNLSREPSFSLNFKYSIAVKYITLHFTIGTYRDLIVIYL